MSSVLYHYLTIAPPISYALIFLAMIVEGDVVLFAVAFLAHRGFFDYGDAVLAVFAGVFVGDVLWYVLGTYLARRAPREGRFIKRLSRRFDKELHRRPRHTIFVSKFIYGLNHIIIMRTGMLKVRFKDFIRADVLAAVAWVLVVGGLGFFSSLSFEYARRYLRYTEVTLLLAIVLFISVEVLVAHFTKEEVEEDGPGQSV